MPSFDVLEPLGPDACRSDRSAPCYYLHLKRRALKRDRDKLSPRELAFVGIFPPRASDGWHQPSDLPSLASALEDDDVAGSSTDALILRAFMAIGTSREQPASGRASCSNAVEARPEAWTCPPSAHRRGDGARIAGREVESGVR